MARSRGETGKRERGRLAAARRRLAAALGWRSDDSKPDEPTIEFDRREDSVAAAMGAAVAHILERPDSIRQRAQTAAAIASAVIAALVGAAITGLLREETEAWNTRTIVLVVLATVAWVVSVVFFVLVVVFAQGKPTGEPYPKFLRQFQEYANTLRKRASQRFPRRSPSFSLSQQWARRSGNCRRRGSVNGSSCCHPLQRQRSASSAGMRYPLTP